MNNIKKSINLLLFIIFFLMLFVKYFQIYLPIEIVHVLTGSMNPTIPQDSVAIVIKHVKANKFDLKDVIMYETHSEYVTHRIVDIEIQNSKFFFITKGDANEKIDYLKVKESQVLGKVLFSIPKIGRFFEIIQTFRGKIALFLTTIQFWLFLKICVLLKEILEENSSTVI